MSSGKFSARDTMILAAKAEKTGDIAQAMTFYAEVLERLPKHPTANKKLKHLRKKSGGSKNLTQNDVNALSNLLQSGNMEAAVKAASQLILIAPNEAVLHNFQGIAFSYIGENVKAMNSFRRAILLRPTYAEALGNLGTLLCDAGRSEEAVDVLRKTISLKPDSAEANNSLGMALCQVDGHIEALDFFDAAIKIRSNYENAINNKGLALKELGEYSSAIETYMAGLAVNSSNTDILTNLGYVYSLTNREEEAVTTLTKVIKLDPKNAEIFMRLGVLKSQLGDIKHAISFLQKSISLDPEKADAYRILSSLKKFKASDPQIAPMKRLFEEPKLDSEKKLHLGFALGKAFEDLGEYKKAFSYWNAGNVIRRENVPYSIDEDKEFFDQVKQVFDADFFKSQNKATCETNKPVFVVGMMRSGTTLVEQILASHSKVSGEGELTYINSFARNNFTKMKENFDVDLVNFGEEYLASLSEAAQKSELVVDKLPINFMWIGLIKAAMPNARVINLVRNPSDVALSIYKNYFEAQGNGYAYNLKELAEFYVLYLDLMQYWRQTLPGFVYDVPYESIVNDLKGEARKLIDYCGLDWEEAVLDFHSTNRVVKTASYAQVRSKIYKGSVNSWLNFEDELAPFIEILTSTGHIK